MVNRKSIEAATIDSILVEVEASGQWPIKSGSFVVGAVLDHKFSNMAEDALTALLGGFTEINCSPAKPDIGTQVSFRVDYSSSQNENNPKPDNYHLNAGEEELAS